METLRRSQSRRQLSTQSWIYRNQKYHIQWAMRFYERNTISRGVKGMSKGGNAKKWYRVAREDGISGALLQSIMVGPEILSNIPFPTLPFRLRYMNICYYDRTLRARIGVSETKWCSRIRGFRSLEISNNIALPPISARGRKENGDYDRKMAPCVFLVMNPRCDIPPLLYSRKHVIFTINLSCVSFTNSRMIHPLQRPAKTQFLGLIDGVGFEK